MTKGEKNGETNLNIKMFKNTSLGGRWREQQARADGCLKTTNLQVLTRIPFIAQYIRCAETCFGGISVETLYKRH